MTGWLEALGGLLIPRSTGRGLRGTGFCQQDEKKEKEAQTKSVTGFSLPII